ncbi:MAG: MaoC family dehydratase [Acetobacteraceae bacterium]|nr:MaoC family dehydratase [Acetobacteraceae bacterium]
MTTLYFEDLSLGMAWRSATTTVTEADIIGFARDFDPQPFHTDPVAAASHRLFRGLAASGWHTAALTMRLFASGTTSIAGGIIGNGIDELRWPRPVRPGDTLAVTSEVVELRPPEPRRGVGWARIRNTTANQNGEVVQTMIASLSIPRRPQG